MADRAFRQCQQKNRYATHVQPVNQLVDELRDPEGRGWMPHVAPWHGGVEARVLSVLRDPGPKVLEGTGSGFLCTENDDPTAEAQARMFLANGVGARDITPWNAYPWYINRAPTAAELEAGIEPLCELIDLMGELRVVLLQGRHAQDSWRRLRRRHPDVITSRPRLEVVCTYHPGRQALWHPDPGIREARKQHRVDAYERVAKALRVDPQQ